MKDTTTENNIVETHAEIQHEGPHIPTLQGEYILGFVSNTNISTFLFLLLILIISLIGNRALKKGGKLKIFFLSTFNYFYKYLSETFGDKKLARKYFPLIVGVFFLVFFGNIFGLIIDWLGSLTTIGVSSIVLKYLRPIHSDLNTTLVLGVATILYALFISFKYNGIGKTLKGYLFNFTGKSIAEKIVNVFVGWLHLIGLPASAASLSLRLFGNIFAGMVLISVIGYLGYLMSQSFFEIGRVLTIPFWFFELFVAFVQAAVFAGLMIAYFKQSIEDHH